MSSEEPVAPPHHFSSIENWKHPDRNYFQFVILSILFGFFGIDHFYLRSFDTGCLKFIMNLLGLGIWYFWDIVQIYADGKKVKDHGLDSPFEWIRGIGKGVFIDPNKKPDPTNVITSKHDFFIYGMLTIFFGIFGADRFYLGATEQGLAKLASVWFILTTIFGLIWVIWDICRLIFYPNSILTEGITAPLPFNLWNADIKGDTFIPERITKGMFNKHISDVQNLWSTDSVRKSGYLIWNWDIWFWNWSMFKQNNPKHGGAENLDNGDPPKFPALPPMETNQGGSFIDLFGGVKDIILSLIKHLFGPTVAVLFDTIQANQSNLRNGAESMAGVLTSVVPSVTTAAINKVSEIANPEYLIEQIKKKAADVNSLRLPQGGNILNQKGGGGDHSDSSGPIIAGTLTAIVIAGSFKMIIDMIGPRV
jgi:TM2 domain-containing membrane protein YozV